MFGFAHMFILVGGGEAHLFFLYCRCFFKIGLFLLSEIMSSELDLELTSQAVLKYIYFYLWRSAVFTICQNIYLFLSCLGFGCFLNLQIYVFH